MQQISTRDKCDKYIQIIKASLKGSPRRHSHHALGSLITSNCYWNLEGARKISKQEHLKLSGGWFISELGGFGLSNEGDIIMISVGPPQITVGALSVNKSCISVGFIVMLGNSFNQSSPSLSLSAVRKLKDVGVRTPEVSRESFWSEELRGIGQRASAVSSIALADTRKAFEISPVIDNQAACWRENIIFINTLICGHFLKPMGNLSCFLTILPLSD